VQDKTGENLGPPFALPNAHVGSLRRFEACEAVVEIPMRWMSIVAALLLGGCSLPLSGGGIFGGLAEEQLSAGTYRVVVPATGLADGATAQDRVLLKAAETARQAGGTHFIVLRGGDVQPSGLVAPVSAAGTPTGQPYAAYVKVFALEPGQQPPSGALIVDEVLHFMSRRQEQTPDPAAAKPGASG
jgi:hypothetical protein